MRGLPPIPASMSSLSSHPITDISEEDVSDDHSLLNDENVSKRTLLGSSSLSAAGNMPSSADDLCTTTSSSSSSHNSINAASTETPVMYTAPSANTAEFELPPPPICAVPVECFELSAGGPRRC
eukprot:scaffold650814_cov56-Prasinocladus_malaysianus.AAC.1